MMYRSRGGQLSEFASEKLGSEARTTVHYCLHSRSAGSDVYSNRDLGTTLNDCAGNTCSGPQEVQGNIRVYVYIYVYVCVYTMCMCVSFMRRCSRGYLHRTYTHTHARTRARARIRTHTPVREIDNSRQTGSKFGVFLANPDRFDRKPTDGPGPVENDPVQMRFFRGKSHSIHRRPPTISTREERARTGRVVIVVAAAAAVTNGLNGGGRAVNIYSALRSPCCYLTGDGIKEHLNFINTYERTTFIAISYTHKGNWVTM